MLPSEQDPSSQLAVPIFSVRPQSGIVAFPGVGLALKPSAAFHVRVFPPHGDPDPGHRAESTFPCMRVWVRFTARGIPAPRHCWGFGKSYTLEDVFL